MPNPAPSKREKLLATAWKLFYRDGFRAVGIDTLLDEADVAKMTLYNHFASKEALIVAVLEKRSEELLQSLSDVIRKPSRATNGPILAAFAWLKEWFKSNDFKGCVFIRALSEYPDVDHPVHQAAARHKAAFRNLFVEAATASGLHDPQTIGSGLSLLVDGAIVAAHATGSATPADTARAAALAMLGR
ncbi:MAG: TetR/AcrR family transcriptional regulator [Opitutaceae bacterium]|nr:TetR/AcrR family transcriptional regulator [Opitutaceae bacterium]